MRRAVVTGIAVAALASGCGGGSDGRGSHGPGTSRSPGSAAAVAPGTSDGRLAGAVVARPGTTRLNGGVERITGRSLRPPKNRKGGVGAEANCTDADVQPTPENLGHVADVLFCLMNAMRANAGLPALTEQEQLAQASVEHSQDMVDNKYFAHDSLDGRDVVTRLKAVAYIPATGQWVVGENLAWGSGTLATPNALVNAWMNSPPHRENLLAADYRDVGLGLAFGTPSQQVDDGVTVTTDFGMRPNPAAAPPARAASSSSARRRRRARALRRCAHRHGASRRRCVRAARRTR